MVGIISYGIYIPKKRIKIAEIAQKWGKNAQQVENSLGIKQKSVSAPDEDSVTLAVEAGQEAFKKTQVRPALIEAIFVGSESHPYAVNPTSTIIGEVLGCGNNYLAADLEFACKAGTAGLQMAFGLIASVKIKYGLVIGSDCAQSKPHDALEYTAGAGAAAYILGSGANLLAEIVDFTSFSSDTPDFWRRDGIRYPSHAGRFTGEPAYFYHTINAGQRLLEKSKTKPSDYDYCVFHMPNGKFPVLAAKRLGFSLKQLKPSLVVEDIGNPYSASSLIGLAKVLNLAKPGEKIFLVSYGSGAGSDGFIFKVKN